eukprot:3628720-Rhodomonas_salina.1
MYLECVGCSVRFRSGPMRCGLFQPRVSCISTRGHLLRADSAVRCVCARREAAAAALTGGAARACRGAGQPGGVQGRELQHVSAAHGVPADEGGAVRGERVRLGELAGLRVRLAGPLQ